MTALTPEQVDDFKVIDCDTHIMEPYDLWTSRVSTKKWGDAVPHVVWSEEAGEDIWLSGDEMIGVGAGSAAAGWPEPPPKRAPHWDDLNPEVWRAPERLGIMDRYGIHAQLLYPNVAGFGAGNFARTDTELALLLVQAYNDYLTDWASESPNRLLPVAAIPFWDLDLAVKEMERARDNGHRGMVFSQSPEYFGQPKLSDPHWDRIWAAAQDLEMPVNFHIGSGDSSGMSMIDPPNSAANWASFPVTFFVGNARTVATLIGSGVCHRFPRLNFVSVESGVGWLAFALDALDWMWQETAVVKEHPEYDLLPSEYFRRQIYGCFWFEHGVSLDAALAKVGPDNILYETDFPHPTSMSPGPASGAVPPRQFIAEKLGYLETDVLRKILHDNAARIYGLD